MRITTKIVSWSSDQGEMYSIQLFVIKFVSDLQQVGGFFRVLQFASPIQFTIAEILLKVALNTINQPKEFTTLYIFFVLFQLVCLMLRKPIKC